MKTPKIKLLSDRILVSKLDTPDILPSGIILLKEDPKDESGFFMATIISVGDYLDERIVPGDVVYIRGGEGWPLTLEDEEYLVVRETAILAFDSQATIDPFEAIELVKEIADWGLKFPDEDHTPLVKRAIKLVYPNS